MRLIDIDQKVIVTICDETKGGMLYEIQLSIGELLAKSLSDFTPQVVGAIPVEWLNEMKRLAADYGDHECVAVIEYLLDRWHNEQEAQDG